MMPKETKTVPLPAHVLHKDPCHTKAAQLCPPYGTASCSGSGRLRIRCSHCVLQHVKCCSRLYASLQQRNGRRKVKAVRKPENNITTAFFASRRQRRPSSRGQEAWSAGQAAAAFSPTGR